MISPIITIDVVYPRTDHRYTLRIETEHHITTFQVYENSVVARVFEFPFMIIIHAETFMFSEYPELKDIFFNGGIAFPDYYETNLFSIAMIEVVEGFGSC